MPPEKRASGKSPGAVRRRSAASSFKALPESSMERPVTPEPSGFNSSYRYTTLPITYTSYRPSIRPRLNLTLRSCLEMFLGVLPMREESQAAI